MKNTIKIILSIFLIFTCILFINYFGVYESFGYNDASNADISIYQDGNLKIKSIENIDVGEKPVKIENEKEYNNIIFEYDGVLLDEINHFVFHQLNDRSYTLNYNVEDDNIYLDRTFMHLSGFNTISLIAITVAGFTFYSLVITLIDLVNSKKNIGGLKDMKYKTNLSTNLHYAFENFKYLVFTIVGIFLLINPLLYYFFIFLIKLTDLQILILYLIFLITVNSILIIYQLRTNNIEVIFDEEYLIVIRGDHLLFKDKFENVIYEELMIKNGNEIFFSTYRELKLKIWSKSNSINGLDLNLTSFGIEKFRLVIKTLEEKSNKSSIYNSHYVQDNKGTFSLQLRKVSKKNLSMLLISFFILVLLFLSFFLNLENTNISIFISIMLLTLFIIMTFSFILKSILFDFKKFKEYTIKIDANYLTIGDMHYKLTDIDAIYISNPNEITSRIRTIEIKTNGDCEKWQINPTNANDKSVYYVDYQQLYYKLGKINKS